ncbi:hypothetical protein NUSPORA_02875 [Nucleospora cyclopteri]
MPFVLTWDYVVTKYHNLYAKRLSIPSKIKTYIETIVLKNIREYFHRLHEEGKKQELSEIAVALMKNKGETGNETTEKQREYKQSFPRKLNNLIFLK